MFHRAYNRGLSSNLRFFYRKQIFLSTRKLNVSKTSSSFAESYEKTATQHVLSAYGMKTENLYSKENFNYVSKIEEHFQPVVLTARPNEFEKLPPKCTSCGALLQSEREIQTGYVPKTKFLESLKSDNLDKLSCMNCFQLRSYNRNSIDRISNGEVINQLRHLRQQKALVLYIVDMLDIDGTMMANLSQIIGKKKRVIIIGNKVDKLPQDDKKGSKQLEHMKDVLKEQCFKYSLEQGCNFRDICLVSGKSGFGVATLIDKIQKHRDTDMDVYMVGCANTGKSTLYNLVVNLLNVHKDEVLPSQGIVHHLPGTTNSLIRHAISLRRLTRMQNRLKEEPWELNQEITADEDFQNFVTQKEYVSLEKLHISETTDQKYLGRDSKSDVGPVQVELVDDDYLSQKKKEKKLNYLYDTPGVLNDSQIIRHLNSTEINYLSPQKWIVPRTFLLKPGGCLFVGGFARLDYIDIQLPDREVEEEFHDVKTPQQSIYVTLMMSPNVPAHVTLHETADEKYERLFVSNFFEIPAGTKERFDNFPPLQPAEYNVVGLNRNINCCDISLHGIGWLSISAITAGRVKLVMNTPNGVGQTLREKPLLPFTVRKKESRGVAYMGHLNRNMYGSSRRKNPQFARIFQHQNQPVYLWKQKIREKMDMERLQSKEDKRVMRLKEGVLLGRMKKLAEKEIELNSLFENVVVDTQKRQLQDS